MTVTERSCQMSTEGFFHKSALPVRRVKYQQISERDSIVLLKVLFHKIGSVIDLINQRIKKVLNCTFTEEPTFHHNLMISGLKTRKGLLTSNIF